MTIRPFILPSNTSLTYCLTHAKALINKHTVTPNDNGCQYYLATYLQALGFTCEHVVIHGVSNLIARWGQGSRHVAFCGHTDVVSPGPLSHWRYPPFEAHIENSQLYGRGAADMKTGLAAMLGACQRVLPGLNQDDFTFWWLITSDEEGDAQWGSKWIKQVLDERGVHLDMCLIGEPTASSATGDTIKIGRRGALSGTIDVVGKQGHVAYPHSCDNAIHRASRIVQGLLDLGWDGGDLDFPGTSLQITHIDSGTFTDNIAPGKCQIEFNVRFDATYTLTTLKAAVLERVLSADNDATIRWSRPCEAYQSHAREGDCLIAMAEAAIYRATGRYPLLSTSGGTSDGRFFATEETQVVELGVPNTTIHQINESIHLSDLLTLEDIYADMLVQLAR